MLQKSREGKFKGSLGTLKSAASIYYGDTEGIWPRDLEKDLVPKYLKEIPTIHLEKYGHSASNKVEYYPFLDKHWKVDAKKFRDTGHWLYDSSVGTLIIDCTHLDEKEKEFYWFGFE